MKTHTTTRAGVRDLAGGKRLAECGRQVDQAEQLLWVEVVLPRLVNDPDETSLLGLGIGQGQIDLPLLERRGIPRVIDADDELLSLRCAFAICLEQILDLEFFAADPRRFVPT